MWATANMGIAAHWSYKTNDGGRGPELRASKWLSGLIDLQKKSTSSIWFQINLSAVITVNLFNQKSRNLIETVVKNIEKIETAIEPKFQDYFVDAMAFPNKKDPFANLFSVVKKPPSKIISDTASGTRKRRRRQ